MHLYAGRRGDINVDVFRHAHPNFVFHDLRLQAGGAKLFCHIIRGLFVFRRGGDVRRRGQYAQMFARKHRIRHGDELLVDRSLFGKVTKAERRGWGGVRGVGGLRRLLRKSD